MQPTRPGCAAVPGPAELLVGLEPGRLDQQPVPVGRRPRRDEGPADSGPTALSPDWTM